MSKLIEEFKLLPAQDREAILETLLIADMILRQDE